MTVTTTTTTTGQAETELMPRLRLLAAASRQVIELDWQREAEDREAEQRAAAVALALDTITERFPDTLAQLLTGQPERLTGLPGQEANTPAGHIPPCAVAYLGEGIWLHHSVDSLIGARLVLVVPCACGRRYRLALIEDDYALAREIDFADAHRDVCLGVCAPSHGTDDSEMW